MEKWQQELADRIDSPEDLKREFNLSDEEIKKLGGVLSNFNLGITKHYFSLINFSNPDDPIKKMIFPSEKELVFRPGDMDDPLGDIKNSPVKGITHRYPDRCLLYPTYVCASYCRYCFRREFVGTPINQLNKTEMDAAINYIKEHKEIREVILTGGDTLILNDKVLESILTRLKEIDHIDFLRIHTKVPVFLPSRITDSLVSILKKADPIYVVTHFCHPNEIDKEASEACKKMVNNGIPVLNQAVLLRGVNDTLEIQKEFLRKLVKIKVKPYYLHHCDLAKGVTHFRTSIEKGIEIMKGLRGFVSGLCIPTYMLDIPGGYGKTPINYNYLRKIKDGVWEVENYRGEKFIYEEILE